MSIQDIIKSKVPDYAEIEVFFFEQCNLRCIHCFQDHESTVGMSKENILAKTNIIEDFFKRTAKTEVVLNIMGGELFQDNLLEEFLPVYSEFIDRIRFLSIQYNKNPKFNFVTNLLVTRHDLFKEWLIQHGLKLSVSYDLTGRFNIKQIEIFKNNIEEYRDQIGLICLVATNPNIQKLLQNGDLYYNYLYENFDCYWDQLTPGPTVPTSLVPSEGQYLTFMKHLIDYYPQCTNLEAFTNKKQSNKMSCPSLNKLLIEADNSTSSCRIQPHKSSYDFISPVSDTNDNIIEKWISDKDCFSCEYFKRCPFSCFVRHDWKRLVRDFDGCIYKETFKYADEKIQ